MCNNLGVAGAAVLTAMDLIAMEASRRTILTSTLEQSFFPMASVWGRSANSQKEQSGWNANLNNGFLNLPTILLTEKIASFVGAPFFLDKQIKGLFLETLCRKGRTLSIDHIWAKLKMPTENTSSKNSSELDGIAKKASYIFYFHVRIMEATLRLWASRPFGLSSVEIGFPTKKYRICISNKQIDNLRNFLFNSRQHEAKMLQDIILVICEKVPKNIFNDNFWALRFHCDRKSIAKIKNLQRELLEPSFTDFIRECFLNISNEQVAIWFLGKFDLEDLLKTLFEFSDFFGGRKEESYEKMATLVSYLFNRGVAIEVFYKNFFDCVGLRPIPDLERLLKEIIKFDARSNEELSDIISTEISLAITDNADYVRHYYIEIYQKIVFARQFVSVTTPKTTAKSTASAGIAVSAAGHITPKASSDLCAQM